MRVGTDEIRDERIDRKREGRGGADTVLGSGVSLIPCKQQQAGTTGHERPSVSEPDDDDGRGGVVSCEPPSLNPAGGVSRNSNAIPPWDAV